MLRKHIVLPITIRTRRDRIRNERIREEVGQRSLEEIIEQIQLKWWGHAFRMAEDSKVKQITRNEGTRMERERKTHDNEFKEKNSIQDRDLNPGL